MSRMWTRSKELVGKGKGWLIMSWNCLVSTQRVNKTKKAQEKGGIGGVG